MSQALKPGVAPNPSKDFNSDNDVQKEIRNLPKPVFNQETNGYLPPQSEDNLGKKTLVSFI